MQVIQQTKEGLDDKTTLLVTYDEQTVDFVVKLQPLYYMCAGNNIDTLNIRKPQ